MSKIEKKLYKHIDNKYKLRDIISKIYNDYILLNKMDDIPVLRKEKAFRDAVRDFVELELARFIEEDEGALEDFYREVIGNNYDDPYDDVYDTSSNLDFN